MRLTSKTLIDSLLGTPLVLLLNSLSLLLGKLMRRDHRLENTRVIVVCKLMGIGSLMQATPLMRELKQKFPEARLLLLTRTSHKAVGERLALVDEQLLLDDASLGRLLGSLSTLLLSMWRLRVDLFVNLEIYSRLGSLVTILSVARNRIGFYATPGDIRAVGIYTDMVYFNHAAPISEIYLQIARALGAKEVSAALSVPTLFESDEAMLQERLRLQGVELMGQPYILVDPNASELRLERRWPIERYTEVIHGLALEYPDYLLMVIGTQNERDYSTRITSALPESLQRRVFNLAGRCSLFELFPLVANARLLITNDSGPMHIGYAFGIPTLALYGPAGPFHYGFNGNNLRHEIIYHRLYCSPCVHHFNEAPCHGDNQCMKKISISEVLQASRRLLNEESSLATPYPSTPFHFEQQDQVFGVMNRTTP